jgi:hypothetical protein
LRGNKIGAVFAPLRLPLRELVANCLIVKQNAAHPSSRIIVIRAASTQDSRGAEN